MKLQLSRARPITSFLVIGFALFASAGFIEGARADSKPADAGANASARPPHPRQNTFMRRQWGIEIVYVRQTAAGYMLEFRYKVHDATKARALSERQTKPMLTHVATGAQMIVPTPAKTGALRNSNTPLDGHVYWMFFANPGQFVKPGDKVNIQIGDFVAKDLIVQ